MASSNEKDVETMPTQKTFKGRVRARMTKTGEAYTAARRQLLRKATEPDAEASAAEQPTAGPDRTAAAGPPAPDGADGATDATAQADFGVSDDAMLGRTGRRHAEWFALLDAWGAVERGHTEIARWLGETHAVPGWWTQSITVSYERARGMRGRHQMRDGYSISVTRTIATDADRVLAAFTHAPLRRRWLAGAPMRPRPTRAALTARFDWSDPPSRVVVTVLRKGADRALVAVGHEKLPDADAADRLKSAWREWLGTLKAVLEQG